MNNNSIEEMLDLLRKMNSESDKENKLTSTEMDKNNIFILGDELVERSLYYQNNNDEHKHLDFIMLHYGVNDPFTIGIDGSAIRVLKLSHVSNSFDCHGIKKVISMNKYAEGMYLFIDDDGLDVEQFEFLYKKNNLTAITIYYTDRSYDYVQLPVNDWHDNYYGYSAQFSPHYLDKLESNENIEDRFEDMLDDCLTYEDSLINSYQCNKAHIRYDGAIDGIGIVVGEIDTWDTIDEFYK